MNEGFSIRDENTLFTYVNDKFCEMLGYSREELIGRPIAEFVDPAELPVLQGQLERRKKGMRGSYELTWIRKSGEKLYTQMSTAPLFDRKGVFRGGFGIKTDITPRKLAEKELDIYQERLRSLALELSLAEERERRRIAGELHDRVGQTLAITKIKLGAMGQQVESPDLIREIAELRRLVEAAIHATRSLTVELSPPILYELGFEAAVEWLAEQIQQQHHLTVHVKKDPQPKPLSQDVRVLLFKVIQELLFNVVKHACASRAEVILEKEGDNIRIVLEDDGKGFEHSENLASLSQKQSFGLFSIRERLGYLGGRFEIRSKPGQGTVVEVSAPLDRKEKIEKQENGDAHTHPSGRRPQNHPRRPPEPS